MENVIFERSQNKFPAAASFKSRAKNQEYSFNPSGNVYLSRTFEVITVGKALFVSSSRDKIVRIGIYLRRILRAACVKARLDFFRKNIKHSHFMVKRNEQVDKCGVKTR